VTANNSVAATRRYEKTDHYDWGAITLNFEPAHKYSTKISLYEIESVPAFVHDCLVVHVFPARMREIVYSVLLTASVEGSVVTTVIRTDGAVVRGIFYRNTCLMLRSSVNVV